MSLDFYAKMCPAIDQIVAGVTAARYRDFPAAGPTVLCLFHHDCFIEVRHGGADNNFRIIYAVSHCVTIIVVLLL
jgi:hypothetical protein